MRDTTPLPPGVLRGEFLNKDGTKLLTVLHNTGKKPTTINGKNLPAGHLSFNVSDMR